MEGDIFSSFFLTDTHELTNARTRIREKIEKTHRLGLQILFSKKKEKRKRSWARVQFARIRYIFTFCRLSILQQKQARGLSWISSFALSAITKCFLDILPKKVLDKWSLRLNPSSFLFYRSKSPHKTKSSFSKPCRRYALLDSRRETKIRSRDPPEQGVFRCIYRMYVCMSREGVPVARNYSPGDSDSW